MQETTTKGYQNWWKSSLTSYTSYRNKPYGPDQPQGGFSNDPLTKLSNNSMKNFADYMFLQLFMAEIPKHICQMVSHGDQTRTTVEDANDIMDTELRVKANCKLMATQEAESQEMEMEVTAFQNQNSRLPMVQKITN